MTAIIAESNPYDREQLKFLAYQLGIKTVSSVGTANWLIEDALKYNPDLIFLGLNGTDGLTAYRKILEYGLSPNLIAISDQVDANLILESIAMNCLDFVIKPVTMDRLSKAVEKAKANIKKELLLSKALPSKIIKITSNHRTLFLNENKFIYAQKIKGKHKTIICIENEKESKIETTACLSEILSQCSEIIFAPNQSSLINVNYIKKVYASDKLLGTYVIQLDYNDVEVDLARRKRKEFEQLYAQVRQSQ